MAEAGLQQEAFELLPFTDSPTGPGLRRLCQIRLEEIQGFTDGFFQGRDELNLPAEASTCLNSLSEVEDFFANLFNLAEPPEASEADLVALADQIDELSEIATVEINNIMALVAASKTA